VKILLLNQTFFPDVASTAQHLSDLAVRLSETGHEVTVVTSNRAYDDGNKRFARRETWQGVNVIRIPSLSLGKASKLRRALTFASFLFVCTLRVLFLPKFDVVVALTSPPLISVLGAFAVALKGGRFVFWVMDLNPDEAVAAGWLSPNSTTAKILSALLRYSLRRAERIVVLDRFMKDRIVAKGISESKIDVIAPWSHNDAVQFDLEGRERFRATHALSDKFVVMYSGNHSPCHSLDTLLAVARQLSDRPEIKFCFVGGGSEFEKVKQLAAVDRLQNILCLPYQPLSALSMSLSAADLHAVVMGDAFTGIVHPCKIYNVLEIGAPVLYIGPPASHVVDVIANVRDTELVCSARHGDVGKIKDYIVAAAGNAERRRSASAVTAAQAFAKETLLPRLVQSIEMAPARGRVASIPSPSERVGETPAIH
jgi:hypothetical protein